MSDIATLNSRYRRLLEAENAPAIKSDAVKRNLLKILENTERETNNGMLTEATQTGDIAQYTPVLISLIRRVVPTLVGNELVGVQALQQPTGRIFAQRIFYGPNRGAGGAEMWANGPVNDGYSPGAAPNPQWSGASDGHGMGTDTAEGLGAYGKEDNIDQNSATTSVNSVMTNPTPWPEVSFGIDYIDVTTKTRALKGKITTEIIQDLKAVHGLDAEAELAAILQAEIVAEIDREIVNTIGSEAKPGARNTQVQGTFDFSVDSDGRWSMEKVQGLMLQLEVEATAIAQETRRGRGNFIITSPELAAYLSMANLITNIYGNTGFVEQINPVGISYYGLLCNRFKVYVDPYATGTYASGHTTHSVIVGYKGSEIDSGLYFCPYVFSLFLKAQDPETFGSILGIKSRYGLINNPYYSQVRNDIGGLNPGKNSYYRKFAVKI
jgi:hypothetical protein